MQRRSVGFLCFGAWAALAQHARAAPEDFAVIMNKDNPNTVDLAFVQRVYLGAVRNWPDGSPVLPFDQPEPSEVREAFSQGLLQRGVSTVKALWAQNIFTGRGYPPKVLPNDAEVRRIVAANRHALGYIRRNQLDDTVKAVLK
jgi:ABC-type phosphate transport system substrate-binding protein